MANLTVKNWRARTGTGNPIGSCTVELTVFRINDVAIMRGSNGLFASLPAELKRDREGKPVLDENGKRQYFPIIEFKDRGIGSQFSNDVIEALRSQGVEL